VDHTGTPSESIQDTLTQFLIGHGKANQADLLLVNVLHQLCGQDGIMLRTIILDTSLQASALSQSFMLSSDQ